MNTEERQLAEMLHRITPQPPRRVTVEDVASRLARETGTREYRMPRGRRRPWSRGWAPVLAAASVFVVAGASAGIAVALNSHHGRATSPADGMPFSSASSRSVSTSPSTTAPSQPSASAQPTWPPVPIAGGPWGAELISPGTLAQDSLTGSGNSLYAITSGYLSRIDPVTGNVLDSARYNPPVLGPPVVAGSTVWVVWSYGGSVVLHGYSDTTLAPVGSVTVPVAGQVSATPEGVLAAGPDGNLYVAAGHGVAVVNPSTHQVIRQISVSAGAVASLAVSPDDSKLYVSTGPFELLTYNPATGAQLGSSRMTQFSSPAGNLVATSGGVWGTVGVGMSEWVWFAPGANLNHMVRVSQGAGGGLESVPTFSGGAVWIGGSHTLVCADPVSGKILDSAPIPTDQGVVEYFGRVTVLGQHAYSDYLDNRDQRAGLVRMTPPAACTT